MHLSTYFPKVIAVGLTGALVAVALTRIDLDDESILTTLDFGWIAELIGKLK